MVLLGRMRSEKYEAHFQFARILRVRGLLTLSMSYRYLYNTVCVWRLSSTDVAERWHHSIDASTIQENLKRTNHDADGVTILPNPAIDNKHWCILNHTLDYPMMRLLHSYVCFSLILPQLAWLESVGAFQPAALKLQPPGTATTQPASCLSFGSSASRRSWNLFAKPKRKLATPPDSIEIPANLRRKVQAKRPALGHIVPQALKTVGGSANPLLRPQGKAREAGMNNPSMLKIAGGTARGRRLDSPTVYLRPMMGKVREAIYSTLTSFGLYDTDATRHLDIFSGSGSVGLESLSRGASHCTFVDLSPDCCSAIERNVNWCQFEGKAQIVTADALKALLEPTAVGIVGQKFQIVTLCPPYEEVVYGDLLEAVATSDLITDDTVVLVEYPVELGCLPHVVPGKDGSAMVGVRNRRYGRTVIAMYVNNPTGRLEVARSRPEEFVDI
jgi:16S rRNA (guanine966-N2)-methyltransferase